MHSFRAGPDLKVTIIADTRGVVSPIKPVPLYVVRARESASTQLAAIRMEPQKASFQTL